MASPSGALSAGSKGLALAVLATAQLVIALDYSIVNVALPDIGRSLGFSGGTVQWVISAYALTFGGLLLLGGPPTCWAGAACSWRRWGCSGWRRWPAG